MNENENAELFDVTEESLASILDVNAESNEPQEESSPSVESVEITDAEEEGEEVQETESADNPESDTVEEDKEEKPDEADPELVVEKDGKRYDFSTAPKEMREVVKSQNRLVNAFVRDDIAKVESELRNLSPSSYANLEQSIVQKSAEANADKWAEWLVSVKPEVVKESLFGSDFKDINLDVLKEMAKLFTEESEEGDDLRMTLELRNPDFAANAKPKLTPEEKAELEEYRKQKKVEEEERKSSQTRQLYTDVFDYVDEQAIVPIVKQFGLMPDANDDEITRRNKERTVNALAPIIDRELSSDPETKDDYAKVLSKIEAHDKAGAMALLPSILAKAEEVALSYFGFIKNQQTASLKQKHTPAKKPPAALSATGKTPPPAPKPLTLAERLETEGDEFYLRNMGVSI